MLFFGFKSFSVRNGQKNKSKMPSYRSRRILGATPRQRAFAAIANLNTLGVPKAPSQHEIALRDLGCLPDYKDVDTFIDTLLIL